MTNNVTPARDEVGLALEARLPESIRTPISTSSPTGPTGAEGGKSVPLQKAEGEKGQPKVDGDQPTLVLPPILSGGELAQLLAHPTLGPELQSWKDKDAARKVAEATSRLRSQVEVELRPQIQAETEQASRRDYLTSLSPQELAQVLTSDKEMAAEYGKMQLELEQNTSDPAQVTQAATVMAIGTQIRAIQKTIADSDLPDALKTTLDPKNFATGKGTEDLVTWSNAVYRALVDHEKEKELGTELETRWEAYKTEKEVELSPQRPNPNLPGQRANPLPDLLETDSRVLLEMALEEKGRR